MDLDNALSDYDARKKRENEAEEVKRQKEARARDAGLKVIETNVVPAIEEIAKQLQAKGHRASTKTFFDNACFPSITLEFTPTPPGEKHPRCLLPSQIAFRHLDEGHLKVTRELKTEHGDASVHTPGAGETTVAYDSVNQEWVRETAVLFVKAVLAAN